MSGILFNPFFQPMTGSAQTYPGAQLYWYQTGTTTAQTVYQEFALSTGHAQPVVADANGVFPDIYLDPNPAARYKFVLDDADDVNITTVDPVTITSPADYGSTVNARTTNFTILDTEGGQVWNTTNAITATLPAAADAGEGFAAIFQNDDTTGDDLTIDGNASELINGAATLVLRPNEAAQLWCTGAAWVALLAKGNNRPNIGTFTRSDLGTDGTEAITGVGFTPSVVVLFGATASGAVPANAFSMGIADGTNDYSVTSHGTSDDWRANVSACLYFDLSSGAADAAVAVTTSSFDADGFTLQFTQDAAGATESGAATIFYIAIP